MLIRIFKLLACVYFIARKLNVDILRLIISFVGSGDYETCELK